ncbi:hypothetical protein E2C01_049378 [Portunus trituberculatus]|uniref:Uncharacterized protein n=1 Tax=Portunus trituberculatus TaxID=210409 RepID=A0A5B7GDT6_PORTR|nr:hypothetical protein [Portunus trituberculatus]
MSCLAVSMKAEVSHHPGIWNIRDEVVIVNFKNNVPDSNKVFVLSLASVTSCSAAPPAAFMSFSLQSTALN